MKWIPLQSVSYRSSLEVSLINRQLQTILELNSEIIIISFSTWLWKISVILLIRCLHVVLEARENGGLSTKWPYQIMKKSLKYIYIKRFPPPKVSPPFPHLPFIVFTCLWNFILPCSHHYIRLILHEARTKNQSYGRTPYSF